MIKADVYYKKNLEEILKNGCTDQEPRPKYKDGTPAYSKFITQVFETYDIQNQEYPITTLRNTAIKTGISEMFWIYQKQSNNLSDAKMLNINWWDDWDIGDNTIGHRYGKTIKTWNLMDNLLDGLKTQPFSRRHIMNMYQEHDLRQTSGLYPCAYETLWSVRRDLDGNYFLDMTLIQRSNDYITAGYINKIQYCALLIMVAQSLSYKPGKFSHLTQNLHIYDRHMSAAYEILNKNPLIEQPKILITPKNNFYDYTINDIKILNTENIKPITSKIEIAI